MNKLHQSDYLIYTKPLVSELGVMVSDTSLICTSFFVEDGELDGEIELN